jgi:hypothetical protein
MKKGKNNGISVTVLSLLDCALVAELQQTTQLFSGTSGPQKPVSNGCVRGSRVHCPGDCYINRDAFTEAPVFTQITLQDRFHLIYELLCH